MSEGFEATKRADAQGEHNGWANYSTWADVHEAFEPEETPCKYCGDDTGDEDEAYCGADCAVDHAAELRAEVATLTRDLRDWQGTARELVRAWDEERVMDLIEQHISVTGSETAGAIGGLRRMLAAVPADA